MNLGPPLAGGADLLTRTTLRIDGISASSVAALIEALHRVPGVLFAEVDEARACAIIAHDEAVPTAALLAAATGAGVGAEALLSAAALTPPPAIRVGTASPAPLPSARVRSLAAAACAIYLALVLIYTLRPNLSEKPWVFATLMILLWAFLLVESIARRRR